MSEDKAIYTLKADELSEIDKEYLKKGGVIIRPKGETQIECVTQTKPVWHLHAGCGEYDDMYQRDKFFNTLLEFADYKKFIH